MQPQIDQKQTYEIVDHKVPYLYILRRSIYLTMCVFAIDLGRYFYVKLPIR